MHFSPIRRSGLSFTDCAVNCHFAKLLANPRALRIVSRAKETQRDFLVVLFFRSFLSRMTWIVRHVSTGQAYNLSLSLVIEYFRLRSPILCGICE